MFKRILLAAAAVSGALALAFTQLPHSYTVQREVVIKASPEAVYSYLTRLEERPKWLVYYQNEPTGKAFTSGVTGQPGATFAWSGDAMGEGSSTLLSTTPNQRLEFALSIKKPFTMESNDTFVVEPTATGTKVVWTNRGGLVGAQRVMSLFLDRIVGPDYAAGLANLKQRIEAGA